MRTATEMILDLHHIERELDEIAREIRQMVPDGCDRNALILTAYNRCGGAASEVARAKRDFAWAIREG